MINDLSSLFLKIIRDYSGSEGFVVNHNFWDNIPVNIDQLSVDQLTFKVHVLIVNQLTINQLTGNHLKDSHCKAMARIVL